MAGGLRYETGRDMPPGMAEKVAVQIVKQLESTAPPLPVAGPEAPKRTIAACELEHLKECLTWDKDDFPAVLKDYTGIVAKPYIAFQYYFENGDYICDSDNWTIEDLLQEIGIEVTPDA